MLQQTSVKPVKKIPDDIICPITSQIMTDPVVLAESGNTYERESILQWLEKNSTDPLTNEKIRDKMIIPNRTVKRLIVSFLEKNKEKNPDIVQETYLPASLIQKLIAAMEKNEIKLFTETLQKDIRLLNKDLKEDKNIFLLCCEAASVEILGIVLSKLGEDVFKIPHVQKDQGVALFLAVSRRLGLEGAKLISAAFEWKNANFQSVLEEAVERPDIGIAEISLKQGAIATTELLNKAYAEKHIEMVKLLIAGISIQEEDKQVDDLLMRSIKDGYAEISLFLLLSLSDKINPNKLNELRESALYSAVQMKNEDVITVLCNHPKIDINQRNGNGDTALHIAVKMGDLKIATLLVQYKANIDIKTEETEKKETALEIAYKKNDLQIQKILVLSGAKIDDLLLKAISEDKETLIQFLLIEAIQFIDPNITCSGGKTALMLAVEKKQTKTVSLLLNHPKLNIYQTDTEGNKALHYAAQENHHESVKMLMKKGASIKDKNHSKKTPPQLAQEKGYQDLSVWMEEKHRTKKIKPFISPLQFEIERQKLEIKDQKKNIDALKFELDRLEKALQEAKGRELKLETKLKEAQRKQPILSPQKSLVPNSSIGGQGLFDPKSAPKVDVISPQQQEKQNQLIEALLKGDFELVKKLESEGASFLYINKDGIYPLVAAVYGCNLELVRYIEEKLKDEATEQWQKIDRKKIHSQMPTVLSADITYKDIGSWYIKHKDAGWCKIYDDNYLSITGYKTWKEPDWLDRGEGLIELWIEEDGHEANKKGITTCGWLWEGKEMIVSPNLVVHKNVVKAICEQLNNLRIYVETKARPQGQKQAIETVSPKITLRKTLPNQPHNSNNAIQFSVFSNNQLWTTITAKEHQERQAQLIDVLLKGDFESVKKLESQGASFSHKNEDGLYPLVAAVYSTNLELVRYVEGKLLKEELSKQWSEIDVAKATEKLDSQMPAKPSKKPYVSIDELAKWYIKHDGASWCAMYDMKVLNDMNCTIWANGRIWSLRGRNVGGANWMRGIKDNAVLYAPSIVVHEDAVKTVREQLNRLRNEVRTKAKKPRSSWSNQQTIPQQTYNQLSKLPMQNEVLIRGKVEAIALYNFETEFESRLSFRQGDTINILDQKGEWWIGELNGKQGLIPFKYVQLKNPYDYILPKSDQNSGWNNLPQPSHTSNMPFFGNQENFFAAPKSESLFISAQQQEKQNQLIAALLSGNLESVKKLESQGASFLYKNKNGLSPLVASIYSINLELVRYVEGKLKYEEALKQWEEVDATKAVEKINTQMPTELSDNVTYGELGNWYIKHKDASWCDMYDVKVLCKMRCINWVAGDGGWTLSGRVGWFHEGRGAFGYNIRNDRRGTSLAGEWGGLLYAPSVVVHEDVVKTIREQLNELRREVEEKAGKQLIQPQALGEGSSIRQMFLR